MNLFSRGVCLLISNEGRIRETNSSSQKRWVKVLACLWKWGVLLCVLTTLSACAPFKESKPFSERVDMEQYAQERYLLAMEYMKASRYELAIQQYSIASTSAVSPELKELARNGREKAERIIEERR